MELVAKLECLRSDAPGKLFDKPLTLEKSVRSGWNEDNALEDEEVDSFLERPPGYKDLTAPSPQPETSTGEGKSDQGKDIAPAPNLPTFDVDLLEIIEAENANNVAQSLLHVLQFRVEGELGERQVFYLREEDKDTEVSEHGTHTNEGVNMNEAAILFGSKPFLGKAMEQKSKGTQLVHPFTPFESYKRSKVSDGCSPEDFVIVPKPTRIILKPNVEVFIDVLTRWVGSLR